MQLSLGLLDVCWSVFPLTVAGLGSGSSVLGLLTGKRLLRFRGRACSGGGVMGEQGGLLVRSWDRASERRRVKVWN